MPDSYFRLAPLILAALALIGVQTEQPSLAALATTLLLGLLITRLWSHRSTESLLYERQASDSRAFAGDQLSVRLRLSNDKLLPLPWVEIDDLLPSPLALLPEDGEVNPHQDGRLRLGGSLSWKERISWHYRLRCERRGIYPLGPATVTTGDPFGLFPRSRVVGGSERLVVYPRLISLEELGLPPGFPLGDASSRRWIFEDPSRTVGVRDYRREDGFRRIHWKATARRQQLQVKVHQHTTTLEVALFLGLDTFGRNGGTGGLRDGEMGGRGDAENETSPLPAGEGPGVGSVPPLPAGEGQGEGNGRAEHSSLITHHSSLTFETAVSIVATLAHRLIGQRHPVGLYLNGGFADSHEGVELRSGSSQEQLIGVLELLAGVSPLPSLPVESLLSRLAPRLPWGSSVIVVVGGISEPLMATLQLLSRQGQRPVVLSLGDTNGFEGGHGVAIHQLSRQGIG